jgi:hypothetical protein
MKIPIKEIASLLLVVGILGLFGYTVFTKPETTPQATVLSPAAKYEHMTDSTIKSMALLVGIADTELVVNLARWETGHYTSPIMRNNNNLFGLRYYPTERNTTATGERNGFAVYDSWLMCIVDLKLYFAKYGQSLRGYSEHFNYKQKISK